MKKTLCLFTLCLLGMTAAAEDGTRQTVTVNGTTVDKTVKKITFSGDDVVLNFTDDSSQTADMEQVSISFVYETTGINNPHPSPLTPQPSKVYNLQGQRIETSNLKKGIYIVDGHKIVIK